MLAMGASDAQAQALLDNKWFSLSVLTALVTELERLSGVGGRPYVLALAATATNEEEARFLAAAVHVLARLHVSGVPIRRVITRGVVVGITADNMAGVIVTEPVTAEADCGLIWIEPWGYPPGCGHGTIATATALAEAGILTPHGADNELVFDTVPGPIRVRLSLAGGQVKQVSVTYVPSFLQLDGATIQVEPWGKLTVDVAWGGCYYAILPASAIGLQVNRASYRSLVEAGKRLLPAVNGQLEVQHPEFPDIRQVHYVQFSGPPSLPEAHARNMRSFGLLTAPAARMTSRSAVMSLTAPSVWIVTPTHRVPAKFSLTTSVRSSSVRFDLVSAGRR